MKKHIPNIITCSRIVGAVCMFFTEPMSLWFYILYTFCGITDILDGMVARATGTVGELGAKLDSVSDLTFYSVMLFKLLPKLWEVLPRIIWYFVGAIILTRIVSYSLAAIKFHRFASMHTYLNKVSGGVVFAIPYFLPTPFISPWCFTVAAVTALASVEELLIHISRKEYIPETKTILACRSARGAVKKM